MRQKWIWQSTKRTAVKFHQFTGVSITVAAYEVDMDKCALWNNQISGRPRCYNPSGTLSVLVPLPRRSRVFGKVAHKRRALWCISPTATVSTNIDPNIHSWKWSLQIIMKRPSNETGVRLNIKVSYQFRDPKLKIRRSCDRLIFNMGIPIPGKTVFRLMRPSIRAYCPWW